MKTTLSWLKTHLDTEAGVAALAERLALHSVLSKLGNYPLRMKLQQARCGHSNASYASLDVAFAQM